MGPVAKHPELPENLAQLITEKFDNALALGTIVYVESGVDVRQGKAFPYQIRVVPAFTKKPNAIQDQVPNSLSNTQGKKTTALIDVLPELVIAETGPFRIILNRYCAVRNQILLTSILPRSQSEPLDAYELTSIHRVLEALPRDYVAFYNCGKESGASQPHKHVQIVCLESGVTQGLFPGRVVSRRDGGEQPALLQHPAVPYRHFITHTAGECTGVYLQSLFNTLFSATRSALSSHPDAIMAPVYNFLMTLDWLIMIPRTSATCNGVGVNALGMLGILWLGNNEQLQVWSATGFDDILLRVGLPNASVE